MGYTTSLSFNTRQLWDLYSSGELDLTPGYQRNEVWTKKRKQRFIRSLALGRDIPKLYFGEVPHPGMFEVSDGQQRISTAFRYVYVDQFKPNDKGNFTLSKMGTVDGLPLCGSFKNLDKILQDRISRSIFDIRVLNNYTVDEKADFFMDIQEASPLNSAEKRRGILSNMRDISKEVVSKDSFYILPNYRGLGRCWQEDFFGKLFHLVAHDFVSYPTPSKMDEDWGSYYDITKSNNYIKKINRITSFIGNNLCQHIPKNSLSNYLLLDLFVAVNNLLDTTNIQYHGELFKDAVIAFDKESKITGDKVSAGLSSLCDPYIVAFTGSMRDNNIKALSERSKVIENFIIKYGADAIKSKDPKRVFGPFDKTMIFAEARRECRICGYVGNSIDEFEIDHIEPHSRGGLTSIDNAQLLCKECNRKKSNKVSEEYKNCVSVSA